MQHFIIDALGPFASPAHRGTINWSKVIFSDLEIDGRIPASVSQNIVVQFTQYVKHIAPLGYDGVSIDDLAHLVSLPFYNPELLALLSDYRKLYAQLFEIAKTHKLKIFVNTDYLFFNQDIREHLQSSGLSAMDFYGSVLEEAFEQFPQIDGVILRVGENDGKDVGGTFLSELLLKTPQQAKDLLHRILPLFERRKKLLIFRTWTVGVYKIGDLIWNEQTYDAVFGSIKSDALIISLKFGDTDFMRYLHLNSLFSRGQHKKIIELQTRREWEGMGTIPSFVGWDYKNYLDKLADNKSIIGIHVWCQTGGWAKKSWSARTYLDNESFWNELNTEVTIGIAKRSQTVEEAIQQFCLRRHISPTDKFTELLRLSETAILKGLYFTPVAEQPLYFRRSRLPSLTWLTWDKVNLSRAVMYLHLLLVPAHNKTISDADEAVGAATQMLQIAKDIQLAPAVIESLGFEHATLEIFAQLKRYVFGQLSPKETDALNKKISSYTRRYPQHYSIPQLTPLKAPRRLPRRLLSAVVRSSAPYRKRDKALLVTSRLQAQLVRFYLRKSKSHLADQSMGFDAFFK